MRRANHRSDIFPALPRLRRCRTPLFGQDGAWHRAFLYLLVPTLLAAWADRPLADPDPGNAWLDTIPAAETTTSWPTGVLEISRKVLPDVQATTLPEMAAPAQPPRLGDPVDGAYQFHLAQKALMSGNLELASEKARSAALADPDQPRYRWWLSGLTLRRFDPASLLDVLPTAIRATLEHPIDRKHLLLQGHLALLLYLALFWTLLAVAYLFRYWQDLGHDLSALAFRSRLHRVRPGLPLLLPVMVILLRPGWLVGLALLSVPLLVKARGKAAIPLLAVWLFVTLLCIPGWPALQNAVPAVDPASETTLLAEAGHQPASPYLAAALKQALAEARDPARRTRLRMALGLQTALRGDYEESNRLFQAVLSQQPQHVGAHVGLANNTYYMGRFDTAVQEYLTAQQLAPASGEIPYNLAQTYFRKLFVPEAEEALRRSRELGFDPPAWQDPTGDANGFSPVIYMGPSDAEIEASSRWEAGRYPRLAHLAAWEPWLGAPPLPLWAVLGGSLLAAAVFAYWRIRLGHPRACASCGCAICARCGEMHEAVWLCAICAETAGRAKSDMVRATLLKNRSRSLEFGRASRRRTMGRLLPGSGLLAAGEPWGGCLRLALLASALFLLLFSWAFDLTSRWEVPSLLLPEEAVHPFWFPLPAAAWPGFLAWPLLVGSVLFLSLFILAQVDGATLRFTPRKGFMVPDTAGAAGTATAASTRRST
jgi:tetratricopeptide (TPR) repeat protein